MESQSPLDEVVEEGERDDHPATYLPIAQRDAGPGPGALRWRLDEGEGHRRPHLHESERLAGGGRDVNLGRPKGIPVQIRWERSVTSVVREHPHRNKVQFVETQT